jgi:hypothetical protein
MGIKDLYPSERKACQGIMLALQLKHCFRNNDSTERQAAVGNIHGVPVCDAELRMMKAFETEARNRFAEIGLVLSNVDWVWEDEKTGKSSPDVSDNINDNTLYWYPRPIISGRTDKLVEVDHDRMKHEIRSGMLDGKEGVIDPNDPTGGLKEPKRKDIF